LTSEVLAALCTGQFLPFALLESPLRRPSTSARPRQSSVAEHVAERLVLHHQDDDVVDLRDEVAQRRIVRTVVTWAQTDPTRV
jgi:hypothetical protein